MKLKINKACDLNSISVLPPHTRRTNVMQQPRSQPSQQSFSQGISSQQTGMFSQLSQNSIDDNITDNQRFSSNEKDNSVKRLSCPAPLSYPREDSQMLMSRSSSNLARRWSSATVPEHKSTVPEHKCQLSDEVEHRISMMETSLNRLGMILDSVQADIMQVNKGTKELSLEVEGIRQKSNAHQDSHHLLIRAQEETRASLETIINHLRTIMQQDKIQEILLAVSNLQEKIDAKYQNQNAIESLSGDMQVIRCNLENLVTLHNMHKPISILPPKVTGAESSTEKPVMMREAEPAKVPRQALPVPKVEMGSWTTVKAEKTAFSNQYGNSCRNLKQRKASLDKNYKTLIKLDDETDDDLSCLIVENESVKHYMDIMEEDAAQILRNARRRKRRHDLKKLASHRK